MAKQELPDLVGVEGTKLRQEEISRKRLPAQDEVVVEVVLLAGVGGLQHMEMLPKMIKL